MSVREGSRKVELNCVAPLIEENSYGRASFPTRRSGTSLTSC
jgi:hypothetical protein